MKYLLLLLSLLFSTNKIISQDDFYISDYFVDVKINKDGSFKVTELISVHFNQARRGILRDIPLKYNVDNETSGNFLDKYFPHELEISDIVVKGFDFKVIKQGTGVRIRIGDPNVYINGDQKYDISYTIENGLLHKKTFSEFYWNLIGDYWKQEIRQCGFSITLPEKTIIQSSDVTIYNGSYGSKNQDVDFTLSGNIIQGEFKGMLGNNQGLTAAIKLPEGSVATFSIYRQLWKYFKFLLIPLFCIFGFLYFWWKHGRDTALAKVVAYMPPNKFDSAAAGFAIDLKVHQRDALSLIPYLGSKGYLRVDQTSKDHIDFYKLKELPVDAPPYQQIFFRGLFSHGDCTSLSDLNNSFYTTLNQVTDSIKTTVLNSEYFTPISVRLYRNSIFFIIGLSLLNAAFCFFSGKIVFAIITIIIGALLAAIAYILLKRSQQGDEVFKEVRGFKQFIQMAEQDKLNFLLKEDPNYFDKTLPYAFAFDLTKTWGNKFKDLSVPPPVWYSSYHPTYLHGGFNMQDFSQTFDSSLDQMRTVMSSQPQPDSSSWSGGSGGGGFSGGGFGGGGGSSW